MEKGQAERVMLLLAETLAEAGVGYRDLAGVGVGIGPGNFTGVRISVAAARGLALTLGVPAIGVSIFDALALDGPIDVVTLIDARRDALWLSSEGLVARQVTLNDLPPEIAGRAVIGHRANKVAVLIGGHALVPALPLPVAIARIAATRLGTPQPRPVPLYLRGADAAPPRDPPPVILP